MATAVYRPRSPARRARHGSAESTPTTKRATWRRPSATARKTITIAVIRGRSTDHNAQRSDHARLDRLRWRYRTRSAGCGRSELLGCLTPPKLMRSDASVRGQDVFAPGCGEQPLATRQEYGARAGAEPGEDAVVVRETTQIGSDGRVHAHCLSLYQAQQVHVRLVGEDLRVGPLDASILTTLDHAFDSFTGLACLARGRALSASAELLRYRPLGSERFRAAPGPRPRPRRSARRTLARGGRGTIPTVRRAEIRERVGELGGYGRSGGPSVRLAAAPRSAWRSWSISSGSRPPRAISVSIAACMA